MAAADGMDERANNPNKFILRSSKQVQSKTRQETKSNFFLDKELIYSSSIYVKKKVPRPGPFSIVN